MHICPIYPPASICPISAPVANCKANCPHWASPCDGHDLSRRRGLPYNTPITDQHVYVTGDTAGAAHSPSQKTKVTQSPTQIARSARLSLTSSLCARSRGGSLRNAMGVTFVVSCTCTCTSSHAVSTARTRVASVPIFVRAHSIYCLGVGAERIIHNRARMPLAKSRCHHRNRNRSRLVQLRGLSRTVGCWTGRSDRKVC